MKIKELEKILDIAIQKITCKKASYISGLASGCGHHLIRRSNKLFRWDLNNVIPLTLQEHYDIHNINNYEKEHLKNKELLFIAENKNKTLKSYLLNHNLTYPEFLKSKIKELLNININIDEIETAKPLIKRNNKYKDKQKQYRKQQYLKSKEIKKQYYKRLKEKQRINNNIK